MPSESVRRWLFWLSFPFLLVGANFYVYGRGLFTWLFGRRIRTRIEEGDVLVVHRPLDVFVLTHWKAPYTDGFRSRLPEGVRLPATHDAGPLSLVVRCVPENLEWFTETIVPEEIRSAEKYSGCSIDLGRRKLQSCSELKAAEAGKGQVSDAP